MRTPKSPLMRRFRDAIIRATAQNVRDGEWTEKRGTAWLLQRAVCDTNDEARDTLRAAIRQLS